MNVLIAPDKFRGTLSAEDAAAAMAEAVRRHYPDATIRVMPLADGGEGTAAVLTRACGGLVLFGTAADPLMRPVRCAYGLSPDGHSAFIDTSEASGLHRLQPHERQPLRGSSRGTGELIAQAVARRVKRIVVGLGGTATIDAGVGLVQALGVGLVNEYESPVVAIAGNLGKIEGLKTERFVLKGSRTEIVFLSDVQVPLVTDDPEAGVMRFAKQKGLKEDDRLMFHAMMGHFATLLASRHGAQPRTAGMGAGGGAAYALSAVHPCRMEPGAAWVMRELGIPEAIHHADLVITGEGQLDETTGDGKCVAVLAEMALRQQKPVLAVVGRNLLSPEQAEELGLSGVEAVEAAWESDPDPAGAYDRLVHATARALRERMLKLG